MTVRESSKDAYSDLLHSGAITGQALTIFEWLKEATRPQTLQEIRNGTGLEINAVSGRVNTLKKTGRVFEHDRRECSITGINVIPVWTKRVERTLFD